MNDDVSTATIINLDHERTRRLREHAPLVQSQAHLLWDRVAELCGVPLRFDD